MIDKIAIKLANRMKENDLISASEGEYYEYALITLMERGITVSTILLLGLLCRQFLPTICFLVFFLSLRKRTGGFHAEKFWQCYLGTAITFVAVVGVAERLSGETSIMLGLLGCSVILIEVIGTINHPNMDMNVIELQEAKKSARIMALLEVAIIVMLVSFGFNGLCVTYMTIAVVLCAILLCFAKIIKQEVKVK
ncbi:MAG: accessory gene regulator B family protein [Acetatifactor sp.]|nr:accessory gene regulator B family protein [Acetatifactor sp.]